MLKRIADWLNLTASERNVLLFLSVTLLAGAGIRLFQKTFAPDTKFDYRSQDSTFASLSREAVTEVEAEEQKVPSVLDLNNATKEQLMTLPGIGSVTADRIIQYRNDQGKFTSADQLASIKGLSEKKVNRLKPLISVQPHYHQSKAKP
jgi:competence ComEA-like helix-hairpin-helix protein